MQLELVRIRARENSILGILFLPKSELFSLELPWRDNQKSVSCIPPGKYACKKIHSGRYGETFHLQDVPNRSEILFHSGNLPAETKGCILLGTRSGRLNDQPAVLESRAAIERMRVELAEVNEFTLDIREHYA